MINEGKNFFSEKISIIADRFVVVIYMKCDEIKRFIDQKESAVIDFKSKKIFKVTENKEINKAKFRLAKTFVSLANRYGGKIIVGIDDVNGSFSIEQGEILSKTTAIDMCREIANDICFPSIGINHEFVKCQKGEVMVINVPKRKGAPHAVKVRNKELSFNSYAFFTRTSDGTFPILGNELLHLFQSNEFPDLSYTFSNIYIYSSTSKSNEKKDEIAETNNISWMEEILPHPFTVQQHVVSKLSETYKEYKQNDEYEIMSSLICEALPYAILDFLIWNPELQWGTKNESQSGARVIGFSNEPVKNIRISDIVKPSTNSQLFRLRGDLSDSLLAKDLSTRPLRFPPNTELKIKVNKNESNIHREIVKKTILSINSPNCFSLSIEFSPSGSFGWGKGYPFGHPLRTIQGNYIPSANDPVAHVKTHCILSGSVQLGTSSLQNIDFFPWLKKLSEGIRQILSYSTQFSSFPDPHLLRIEKLVREIKDQLVKD
jgi:hypothetical protein